MSWIDNQKLERELSSDERNLVDAIDEIVTEHKLSESLSALKADINNEAMWKLSRKERRAAQRWNTKQVKRLTKCTRL